MKVKLIDVENFPEYTEVGSCELCMSTQWVEQPVFIFEKEDGTRVEVDGYDWQWGHYDQVYIDNVVDFAAFVAKKDFPEGTVLDHGWLYGLCQDYEYGDEEDED